MLVDAAALVPTNRRAAASTSIDFPKDAPCTTVTL
jgi:hypothetical protein